MNRFDNRYKTNDLPWDTQRPDYNLTSFITSGKINPCNTLEIGCGTGENAIWLARRGFNIKAVDISPKAIEMAINKSDNYGVKLNFEISDFTADKPENEKYDFIFDRGCFHSMKTDKEKELFVNNVSQSLTHNGVWLSLIGSSDSPHEGTGPPKLSATEITSLVENQFRIISLNSGNFDSDTTVAPIIWICHMEKR